MSRPNGSASGLERAFECAASLVLPRVNRGSAYADRGTGGHGFVRSVLTGTPIANALEIVADPELRETCARIDFRKLGGDLLDVRCEIAYALDPFARTARELGQNIGREYEAAAERAGAPLTPDEIPGSDDIEGMRPDGVGVVLDMKFGWDEVTPCAENAQLGFFAAARMLLGGVGVVEKRIAYVRPNGDVRLDSAEFTRFDTDTFLDDVEAALLRVRRARRVYLAEGRVDVSAGAWCKYCDSMSYCPEYVSLARAMLPALEDVEPRIAMMSQVEKGTAWRQAKKIETLLGRVLDALKAHARQESYPTDDEHEVRVSSYMRSDFSTGAALGLLKSKGATEAEIAGCYTQVPVHSVKELKIKGAKRKRAKRAA